MKLFLLLALGIMGTLADESQVLKDFADGSTQFTAGVYKELVKSNSGSFMVCPLSVDVLLALFHAGAKGRTARQLSDVLHLSDDRSKIDEVFTNLASHLKSTDHYDLTSANKVYLQNGFQISDQFKTTAVKVFDSEIQNINFGANQEAANEMNHWVEEKTHDKIKDLISPDDLKEGPPVAVLINAMYFRGKWMKQFYSDATTMKPFHINSKNEVQVEMMELADSFNAYESAELNAKFLEMPYEGDDISMTFVLPNDVEGLSKLEERIGDVLVAPAYHDGRVHVIIPKFKMETSIKFAPILKAMGVEEPFSNAADFSGFGANKDLLKISKIIQKTFIEVEEKGTLKISKIIQKTFIEVEEKGTTAAAAIAGFPIPYSADYVPPPVLQFVADHPFIYYIKIKGIIVFVGRYNGP